MPGPPRPPGWFTVDDEHLFGLAHRSQERADTKGDILEIGVYWGLSALTLAGFRRGAERLVLLDIFESAPLPGANTTEMSTYDRRRPPTIEEFRASWRQYEVDDPDEIVVGPSSLLYDRHDLDGTFRFVHIDGSHSYEVVKDDIRTVRRLAQPGAVIVLDDYRSLHTPGVAAAAWEAVLTDGLVPLCATDLKLYTTWQPELCAFDHATIMSGLLVPDRAFVVDDVAGHDVVIVQQSAPMKDPMEQERSRTRKFAHAVLPPVVSRAIASARRVRMART